jgi:hypothetical protein
MTAIPLSKIARLHRHRPYIERGRTVTLTRGGCPLYRVNSGRQGALPSKVNRLAIAEFHRRPGQTLEALPARDVEAIMLTFHGRDSMQIQLIGERDDQP